MSATVDTLVKDLKDAVGVFEAEYAKYLDKGTNSAGSKARKALMTAKKSVGSLRKEILADQKTKKAAKKAE